MTLKAAILAMLVTGLSARDYVWTRATDNYGWGHTAYVLNVVTFRDRLWAFEGSVIHSSANGTDWTIETRSPGWKGDVALGQALVFGDRLWTLGGHYDEGRHLRNDVWSSHDGRTWHQVTASAQWSLRRGHATAAFRGRIWLFGGDGLNDIWSSADGGQWTRVVEHAPWSPRARHRVVAWNDRLWLVGGVTADRQLCDVWSSTDGASWSQVTECAEWGPRFVPAVAVYDGKLWIAGGMQKNDGWFSVDGHRWQRAMENAGWFPRGGASLAVLDGKLWLLGGKTGVSSNSNPQDIWCMTPSRQPLAFSWSLTAGSLRPLRPLIRAQMPLEERPHAVPRIALLR